MIVKESRMLMATLIKGTSSSFTLLMTRASTNSALRGKVKRDFGCFVRTARGSVDRAVRRRRDRGGNKVTN